MKWLLANIAAGAVRYGAQIVLTAIVLVFGIDPGGILARNWTTPPEWVADPRTRFLIVLVGVVGIFLIQLLSRTRSFTPAHGAPLKDAFYHYAHRWRLTEDELVSEDYETAAIDLRQGAANGEITIWGRRNNADDLRHDISIPPLKPIDKGYWLDRGFDYFSIVRSPRARTDRPMTIIDNLQVDSFDDLRVDMRQVRRHAPQSSIIIRIARWIGHASRKKVETIRGHRAPQRPRPGADATALALPTMVGLREQSTSISPLTITIGEGDGFQRHRAAGSRYTATKRVGVILSNSGVRSLRNCKLVVTKIEPDEGWHMPIVLEDSFDINPGDTKLVFVVDYIESMEDGGVSGSTFITLDGGDSALDGRPIGRDNALTLKATALDVPPREARLRAWIEKGAFVSKRQDKSKTRRFALSPPSSSPA